MEENIEIKKFLDKCMTIYGIMRKNPPPGPVVIGDRKPTKITDIQLKLDGTVRTYLEGEKYPVRFFTPQEAVNIVGIYKRLFSLIIKSGFSGLIILWLGRKIWPKWLEKIFELYSIVLKEEHWSQPIKELRRILDINPVYKDAISLIFENDMAYRYRMQDILSELDKNSLMNNPHKEIKRLFNILIYREHDSCKKIWLAMYRISWLIALLAKKPLLKLNIDEIKLSEEDIYWSYINYSYDCKGISREQAKKLYEQEKNIQ